MGESDTSSAQHIAPHFTAGELGSHLYVSAEGEYEVIKDGKVLGRLGVGKAFGELAILYNCKRTASIKVRFNSVKLDRSPNHLVYNKRNQTSLYR